MFFLIKVYLICNVVLISAVEQNDSVIHMCTFFFIFFSTMAYPRILNIVPCAIQWDLVVYLSYIYNSLLLLTPNSHPFPPPTCSPLAATNLFSVSVSLFLFF